MHVHSKFYSGLFGSEMESGFVCLLVFYFLRQGCLIAPADLELDM